MVGIIAKIHTTRTMMISDAENSTKMMSVQGKLWMKITGAGTTHA